MIRTLMERSAVYRRALAPIMSFAGALGLAAAFLGRFLGVTQPQSFVAYWYGVAFVVILGAFLMVRRQAWQQSEPFWSPPTRRVALALLPSLGAGFVLGLFMVLATKGAGADAKAVGSWPVTVCLPLAWVTLYGCALHASGFFMTRGMRLFGWVFVVGGCGALLLGLVSGEPSSPGKLLCAGHCLMGFFFGVLHLAYGIYLFFTEPHGTET